MQAEDANQASANVSSMGDMIENNTLQLARLHEISGNMKDVSIEAIAQFEQLNTVMQDVKDAIHFLSQQTGLTNESVAKIRSAAGMDTILENSKSLENVRIDTVAIVQNSAALSEETSASLEEIMASIENIYNELGDISEKAGLLKKLSQEMTASVAAFHI